MTGAIEILLGLLAYFVIVLAIAGFAGFNRLSGDE